MGWLLNAKLADHVVILEGILEEATRMGSQALAKHENLIIWLDLSQNTPPGHENLIISLDLSQKTSPEEENLSIPFDLSQKTPSKIKAARANPRRAAL